MDRLDNILQEMRSNASKPPSRTTAPRPTLSSKRSRLLLAAVGVLLLTVGFVAWRSNAKVVPQPVVHPTHAQRTMAASPNANVVSDLMRTPTPLQWKPVVEQLDARRWRAFRERDSRRLLGVNDWGSAAMKTDSEMIRQLVEAGAFVQSTPVHVLSVKEQYVTVGERDPRAMLTVVDRMDEYRLVDAKGGVLRTVPPRPAVTWNVELLNHGVYGWVYLSAVRATKP